MCRTVDLLRASLLCLGLSVCACATRDAQSCSAPEMSRESVAEIVEAEIRRRGGAPKPGRRSRIKVRRDGCDYVYQEISIPKRPGGFLIVRIDQFGEVVDFLPGL